MLAVDAMGGDHAPYAIVQGSLAAAKQGIPLLLFGDEKQIRTILNAHYSDWQTLPITIEHCSEIITMDEEPSKAVMRKKDASLVRAAQAVAAKRAQALVSAGNSGAVLAASALIIGRIPGILRPVLGGFLPTKNSTVFCLDLGANVDCKPEFLEQFAHMGHVYVQQIKNIASPRIALLSNGHEPYKGSLLIKQTYDRLQESTLNFVGNIESRDIFDDRVDVIVCDGFVGNSVLKAMQGLSGTINYWIKQESQKSWLYTLGLLLSSGLFKKIKQKTDYARIGGALLLGVNQPVILAHGCSQADALCNALLFAHATVNTQRVDAFNRQVMLQLPGLRVQADSRYSSSPSA